MAMTIRPVICEMKPAITPFIPTEKATRPIDLSSSPAIDKQKIILQPRVCTLRSYGSADRTAVIRTRKDREETVMEVEKSSPFFTTLSEYIESSKRSQDFETISGRLAMVVFAATVTEEFVTGSSLFRKMDLQGIAEAGGVCVAAVACAATFAWFSSARNRVGQVFVIAIPSLILSLIKSSMACFMIIMIGLMICEDKQVHEFDFHCGNFEIEGDGQNTIDT